MDFEKAFIQKQGINELRVEERLVSEYLSNLGIPIEYYTEKDIHRRRLPLSMASIVVGDMPCIYGAMKQLGIEIPSANPYPKSLTQYMRRNIWQMSLAQLESELLDGRTYPVFAKPKSQHKKFTGQVFTSEADLYFVYGASRKLELICSEVALHLKSVLNQKSAG